MSKNYNLYIDSTDKISGTNNNAVFHINWKELLTDPTETLFEVSFTFNSIDTYDDVNFFQIFMDTNSSSLSYEVDRHCKTNILGYVSKISNYQNNIPKCILKPTDNILKLKFFSQNRYLVAPPKTTFFKSNIALTALNVDATSNPSTELNNNDIIIGCNIPANTTIVARTGNYAYTISTSIATTGAMPTTSISVAPTDMSQWTMILDIKPIKN